MPRSSGLRIPPARSQTPAPGRRPKAWAAAAMGLLVVVGCAYFNTFYNANQLFKEAERLRSGPGGPDAASATYGQAIDKCHDLIRYHPNSGYVDDALFMIGMSHLHRGENVQAQDSFRDLLERFPKTDFRERAWFNMGLAALRVGDVGGALGAFQSLREEYPSSDYNVQAMYRTAESQLDSRDNDAARAALEAFIAEYSKSRFAAEAQVMIANTYFDEHRYEEAQREFEKALQLDLSDEQRYDARLYVALAKRNQAEQTLADPALYTRDDLPEGLRLDLPQAQEADSSASNAGNANAGARDAGATQSGNADDVHPAARDMASVAETLPDSLRALREHAFELLRQAEKDLDDLRKPARKLGVELGLRVELASTVALLGDPDGAIAELDQIARTDPRGQTGARAQYAIGEIHRRRGNLREAQVAYDGAQRISRTSDVGKLAQKKSLAIRARGAALEKLREAPELLRRWRVARGLEEPSAADTDLVGPDSVHASLDAELRFEESAAHLLRVAEIDLLELDQPRLALREFESLLRDYGGSGASPRAAFAIAWIYDTVLLDSSRALEAYDAVVRNYPATPQARQARESARFLRAAASQSTTEVQQPSSQP